MNQAYYTIRLMAILSLAILTVVCSVLLTSCVKGEKNGQVIAQVDNETLTMEEFKANFSPQQFKTLTPEQKKEYVQQWITMTLMAKAADEQGLGKDKATLQKVRYAEKKIKANALIASRLASEKISEEDMFNYYRIHQGDFEQPLMNYRVQRIYVTDNTMLGKVQQEIAAGMKFEDAARVYSQEALGRNGGFMGSVSHDGADSLFWQAVSKVKLLELTVLNKNDGYFILRAYEQEPGTGETGFEAAKDEIRRRILDERRKQVYDDLIKELKSKSDVYLMI